MSTRLADVLEALVDPGTTKPVDVAEREFPTDYSRTLERAAERSGTDEAVQVMHAQIAGFPVVIVGGEFEFLAGSVGQAAADRVVAGYKLATEEKVPVITLPTSGGTRMQEGTAAFFRMTDIARAAGQHLATGAARIGWLRSPTTGGVMATWGSYADITGAEPGALLGFLGPRVYEALYNEPFPPDVQTAENLARVGVIDAVVPLADLRSWVTGILSVVAGDDFHDAVSPSSDPHLVDAWDAIQRTRSADRPGPDQVLDLLTERTELTGTGTGETGSGIRLCLGRLRGRRLVVVAQTRHEVTPADLRVAQRGMRLAERLGLPVVTLVDTPGGELSAAAEESAMAGEIARTLQTLTNLRVPSVCCIVGQGCGGAALALIPARIVLCMQNGWVSPLPPEGASVIMHRTPDRAADMAREQGVSAMALLASGVVDRVIAERRDLAASVADAVCEALDAQ